MKFMLTIYDPIAEPARVSEAETNDVMARHVGDAGPVVQNRRSRDAGGVRGILKVREYRRTPAPGAER
jgi:hypothetical protein